MIVEIFGFTILLVATSCGYYFWRKTRDKDYLRLTRFGIVGLALDVIDHLIDSINGAFPAPAGLKLIIDISFILFGAIFVFLLLRIMLGRKKSRE